MLIVQAPSAVTLNTISPSVDGLVKNGCCYEGKMNVIVVQCDSKSSKKSSHHKRLAIGVPVC